LRKIFKLFPKIFENPPTPKISGYDPGNCVIFHTMKKKLFSKLKSEN